MLVGKLKEVAFFSLGLDPKSLLTQWSETPNDGVQCVVGPHTCTCAITPKSA